MKIESTDQDLRTMLSSAYYKIPRFQRPYSWDRENVEEFWEDVIHDNPQDYFIGSMVVYKDGTIALGGTTTLGGAELTVNGSSYLNGTTTITNLTNSSVDTYPLELCPRFRPERCSRCLPSISPCQMMVPP